MIIKSVKLHNIRSYVNELIEFPEGSVLLSGDIGSGKSTILLAIEFALFGIRSGLSGPLLLRHGAKDGNVELRFSVDNNDIVIKRSLKRARDIVKQEPGYIIKNGRKKEGTAVELKAEMLEILGYPKEMLTKSKDLIYRYTVYTPQEEMNNILTDETEGRIETLRKVFAIDTYKKVAVNSSIILRSVKEKKKFYENEVLVLGDLRVKEKESKTEIEELKKNIEWIIPKIDLRKKTLEEHKEEERSLNKSFEQYRILQKRKDILDVEIHNKSLSVKEFGDDIVSLDKGVEEFKKRLSALKPITEDVQSKLKEKESEFFSKRDAKSRLIELNEQMNQRIAVIQKELKELERSYEDVSKLDKRREELDAVISQNVEHEKKLAKLKQDMRDIQTKLGEGKVSEKNAAEAIEQFSSLSTCPLCLQRVEHSHKNIIIDRKKQELFLLKKDIEKLAEEDRSGQEGLIKIEADIKQGIVAEKEREKILGELRIAALSQSQFRKKKEELGKYEKILKDVEKRIEGLSQQVLQKLEDKIKELREIEKEQTLRKQIIVQIDEKRERIEFLEKRISEINKILKAQNSEKNGIKEKLQVLEGIDKRAEELQKKIEILREEEKKLEFEKVRFENQKESAEKILRIVQKEIESKEKIQNRVQRLAGLQEWLEECFIPLMNSIEKHVLLKIYHEFNQFFQDWFDTLIEDESISIRIDDSFSPVIEQNGFETTIDHLSGGEKTSCALAYRLSLNKVINDVVGSIKTKEIIILDEPTDGFSSEQLDRVRDVLDQIGVRQVIIVSHESKIESFVDHVIKIEKEEHASRVAG